MRRLLGGRWVLRRALVIARAAVQARVAGARLDLDIAGDARFGPRFRVTVDPGTHNRLTVGRGVHVADSVHVQLRGGRVTLGDGASIRRGTVLNVSGELILEGDNIISYYNVIHCAERIRLGRYASTNEFVTIVDSRHFHDGEHEFFYENVEAAPIEIGRNVWVANKSSVLLGVTVGDDAIIAAHAVVHSDVPAKAIVGGVPARVIRQR